MVEVLCILFILGFLSGKIGINNIHTFFNIFAQKNVFVGSFQNLLHRDLARLHLLIKLAGSTLQ